jgi:hypothetical protein
MAPVHLARRTQLLSVIALDASLAVHYAVLLALCLAPLRAQRSACGR